MLFAFLIILPHWQSVDSEIPYLWKTRSRLSCIANNMAADTLATLSPGYQQPWYFDLVYTEYSIAG